MRPRPTVGPPPASSSRQGEQPTPVEVHQARAPCGAESQAGAQSDFAKSDGRVGQRLDDLARCTRVRRPHARRTMRQGSMASAVSGSPATRPVPDRWPARTWRFVPARRQAEDPARRRRDTLPSRRATTATRGVERAPTSLSRWGPGARSLAPASVVTRYRLDRFAPATWWGLSRCAKRTRMAGTLRGFGSARRSFLQQSVWG